MLKLENIKILKEEYVDIEGNVLRKEPKFYSEYGLGSYGVVGRKIEVMLDNK